MKVIVTGRNIDVTPAIKKHVEVKLEKFDKYFQSEIEAHATFSVLKDRQIKDCQIVEITIPIKGVIFRAEEHSPDIYASVDMAIDKLTRQITKHKTKLEKRYKKHETIKFEEIPAYEGEEFEDESSIVKMKSFAVKPMDPEEAVLQMEMLGHNFFVFRNAETEEINVVYQRKDKKYGLIEPTL